MISEYVRPIAFGLLILSFFNIIAYFVIICSIFRTISLGIPRFFIISNTCLCNIIAILSIDGKLIEAYATNKVHITLVDYVSDSIIRISHLAFLLSICFLSVDRFLKVCYHSQYHNIITERKTQNILRSFWFISIIIISCFWIKKAGENVPSTYWKPLVWLFLFIRAATITIITSVSLFTQFIINSQIEIMRRKRNIFVIVSDKMLRLNDSKTTIKDTITLNNFITVFLIVSILFDILALEYGMLSNILNILSTLTILTINPYVYIYTQVEIRNEVKRIINCSCHEQNQVIPTDNRISPEFSSSKIFIVEQLRESGLVPDI